MRFYRKNQKVRNQDGFTIVELLIYMGLLVIMIVIFTQIFVSILDNQLRSTNTSNVAEDGRYIYSRFIYDVNRADSIASPSAFGSSSASMTLSIGGVNNTFTASNGSLLVTTPTSSYVLNGYGSTVSNLLFTKVGTPSAKGTIRMQFTVTGAINSRGVSDIQNFQTTAGLR
ncbi:MAG: hypothetical protein E6P95_02690 [Candidatus Moraniibacteriota bacterium]|nr:MAG: hypothetical protein E6P95_02690 [Candidatus Moranbacteria bacterium]